MPTESFKCLHKYNLYHPGQFLPVLLENHMDKFSYKVRVEGYGEHKMPRQLPTRGKPTSLSMVQVSSSFILFLTLLTIILPIIKGKTQLKIIRK